MKKLNILIVSLLMINTLFAQVTLTRKDNIPVTGDTSRTREIVYVDPGPAGEDMVWNYSALKFTGKNTSCGVSADPSLKASGNAGETLILSEDGYDYTYVTGTDGYRETAYDSPSRHLVMTYSDPIEKMKYPFVYGQKYSDSFSGVAMYSGNSRIDLDGVYTVSADAYGTLILPDRILKNALRVNTIKHSLQIGNCGSTQATVNKYYWFAPGYRYPVMLLCTATTQYGANEPQVTTVAWINTDQKPSGSQVSSSDSKTVAGDLQNSVMVYPNPFTDQVTYSYLLTTQTPVMVELYDMSGRVDTKVEKRQVQSEGLHTVILQASDLGLSPGIYYLRFTLGKEVVVHKIVKI